MEGNGHDNVIAGNGDNLIVAGLGKHAVQVGNGINILIDGSVQLTQAGDTLGNVLADSTNDLLNDGSNPTKLAADASGIRTRLHVTDNTSNANTLHAGSGLDWFWATYAHDNLNVKKTDLLN